MDKWFRCEKCGEMIERAKEKYSKQLFTEREGDDLPVYVETDSEHAQSQFICQKILECREEGVDLSKIAVLVRSGWHSNDLEVALKSANIPFSKFGGFKFMETAHVKDVLSYMKLMSNPLDAISWHRVLLFLEGLGMKSAQEIVDALFAQSSLLVKEGPGAALQPDLSRFAKKKFYKDLVILVRMLTTEVKKSPAALLSDVIAYYQPYFKEKYDDFHKREQDLNSLVALSERFRSLAAMLDEALQEFRVCFSPMKKNG